MMMMMMIIIITTTTTTITTCSVCLSEIQHITISNISDFSMNHSLCDGHTNGDQFPCKQLTEQTHNVTQWPYLKHLCIYISWILSKVQESKCSLCAALQQILICNK